MRKLVLLLLLPLLSVASTARATIFGQIHGARQAWNRAGSAFCAAPLGLSAIYSSPQSRRGWGQFRSLHGIFICSPR